MFSMNFSTWKKIFFEFVCFPRFYDPNNVPHKSKNLVKNEVFHQNHQKSTKIDFFSNSFDRSLEYLLKYIGYDFWGHTTFFWQKYEILNKTKILKKKTKSTFFFFFSNTVTIIFFSALLMQKPRLFNVYLFFEKKVLFVFFFKNFFCSKSHIFVKKSRMTSKIIPNVLQEVL